MLRFFLFTTLLALTKSEDQNFFQGEWRQVAHLSTRDELAALVCDYLTFEVIKNVTEGNTILLKINNTEFLKPAKVVKSEDKVDALLNSPILSEDHDNIIPGLFVFRKLTDNYLMVYWMKQPGEKKWTLMAKKLPTRAELEQFLDFNEDFKDLHRAILCTKEVLQNPSLEEDEVFVEVAKPKI